MHRGRPILLVSRGLDPVGSGCELELVVAGRAAAGLPVELAVTSAGGSVPERLAARGHAVHRLGRRPVVDAGEYLEVRRAGEIQRVVESFLRHHFQRFQGLRSLETLRHLHGETTPAREPKVADSPRGTGRGEW